MPPVHYPAPSSVPRLLRFTHHACIRMQQRGIRKADIGLVLCYGRCIHAKGVEFHVVGHKEVVRWSSLGIHLSHLAGVQVLTSQTGVVITTYRSHNLHAIQAEPRRHRRQLRCRYVHR